MGEREKGTFEKLGEDIGGSLGRAAGRANDMAANALGSLLGSALQSMGDWWASSEARQAVSEFSGTDEDACRDHFSSTESAGAAGAYEQARPHYQFGYVAGRNPAYQGQKFDEVEEELQRSWEAAARDDLGEWPDARDRVSFAFER
jgi:hypothetical protein